jgi:hypothetical protein
MYHRVTIEEGSFLTWVRVWFAQDQARSPKMREPWASPKCIDNGAPPPTSERPRDVSANGCANFEYRDSKHLERLPAF